MLIKRPVKKKNTLSLPHGVPQTCPPLRKGPLLFLEKLSPCISKQTYSFWFWALGPLHFLAPSGSLVNCLVGLLGLSFSSFLRVSTTAVLLYLVGKFIHLNSSKRGHAPSEVVFLNTLLLSLQNSLFFSSSAPVLSVGLFHTFRPLWYECTFSFLFVLALSSLASIRGLSSSCLVAVVSFSNAGGWH